MTESGYYPMGAEFDKNAPYNQVEPEPLELEVTVSVTLSKTMKIKVNDYLEEIEDDEEGKHRNIDFSVCDLQSAVNSQIYLPQDSGLIFDNYISKYSNLKNESSYNETKKIVDDLSDWNVDEMEVIRNTKG